jgi:hypothetical protein
MIELVNQRKDVKRQWLGFGKSVIWLLPMLAIGPLAFAGIGAVTLIDWTGIPVFDVGNGLLSCLLIVIGGTIAGLIVGLGQSLALRHVVSWADKWVRATVTGWTIAGVLWAAIFLVLGGNHFSVSLNGILPTTLLAGLATGMGIGVGQWFLMRRWIKMPLWWVGVTMLGWYLGAVGAYFTSDWGYYITPLTVASVVAGVVTTVGLNVLVCKVRNEDAEANKVL